MQVAEILKRKVGNKPLLIRVIYENKKVNKS